MIPDLPLDNPRGDMLGRALVLAGNLLHSVGAQILKTRNEDLGAALQRSEYEAGQLIHRAYVLGRYHQHTGDPGPASTAALVEHVRALYEAGPDVDEHQAPDVDEHQAAAAPSSTAAAADVDEHRQ